MHRVAEQGEEETGGVRVRAGAGREVALVQTEAGVEQEGPGAGARAAEGRARGWGCVGVLAASNKNSLCPKWKDPHEGSSGDSQEALMEVESEAGPGFPPRPCWGRGGGDARHKPPGSPAPRLLPCVTSCHSPRLRFMKRPQSGHPAAGLP